MCEMGIQQNLKYESLYKSMKMWVCVKELKHMPEVVSGKEGEEGLRA